jgi:ERCC4-related helicase
VAKWIHGYCIRLFRIEVHSQKKETRHESLESAKCSQYLFIATDTYFTELGMQVLHNDLKSGVCPGKSIVCIVIDECHRATGNQTSVTALQEIFKATDGAVRVVGLSATPGSQPDKVQEVITNLRISKVHFFGEDHPDIRDFRYERVEEVRVVEESEQVGECLQMLGKVQHSLLET